MANTSLCLILGFNSAEGGVCHELLSFVEKLNEAL